MVLYEYNLSILLKLTKYVFYLFIYLMWPFSNAGRIISERSCSNFASTNRIHIIKVKCVCLLRQVCIKV